MRLNSKQIEVSTIQDVLDFYHGNQSVTAKELKVNRGTFRAMLADKRKHVVLVENGEYTLLK